MKCLEDQLVDHLAMVKCKDIFMSGTLTQCNIFTPRGCSYGYAPLALRLMNSALCLDQLWRWPEENDFSVWVSPESC